ncbi:DUF1120 domain-containing protein [Enterobacter pasteurii]
MKKVILASLIALASASAFAEPTAVLKVHGTLTNAACSPSIGNGGVIDYGFIRLGDLSATENNKIGMKQVPVTITCTAPTKVGFTILDNRADSNAQLPLDIGGNQNQSAKYYTYGVGTTTEGVKIGNYGMWMTDVTADGNTVDPVSNNHDWEASKWHKSGSRAAMRLRPPPLRQPEPRRRLPLPRLTLTLLLT